MENELHQTVKDYYGKELQGTQDLKTNACCTAVNYPPHIKEALKNIHDEVMAKYYGCGLTIPTTLKGKKVLDLGSGSGRDCYILSQLVGEQGEVVGVDMTDEQLDVANRHLEYHREKFGYRKNNVRFLKGQIENLAELDLPDNHFDVIVSNCVVNLASDKQAVLNEAYRVLRSGGEMYFSDVYADRRIPEVLKRDPVLYGECLSGALYTQDFLRFSQKAGFTDPRLVDDRPLEIENAELQNKVGNIRFFSSTYRLFKIEGLETLCEDYGQAVCYKGGLEEMPNAFVLDDHHVFEKGKIERVCGNTWLMLNQTRFQEFFDFYGNFETHFGLFEECEPTKGTSEEGSSSSSSSCC